MHIFTHLKYVGNTNVIFILEELGKLRKKEIHDGLMRIELRRKKSSEGS